MKYSPAIIFIFLLFYLSPASGQYYNTGQDPSSIRWMRIKTEKFDVIYPREYGQKGIDFARTLDSSYNQLKSLFPAKKARIPVVIHSHSTRSNGYVAWAPRRMEIYPAPDQNSIPGNQHRLLTIHELTHVMEMESLNAGFTKAMSYLTGEQFTGAVAALLPLWYLEGNAVVSETMLSSSGRGRNPSFQQQLKAIAAEYGNYKYDKIVNGSFRDHVPDHYQSGYQMTAWAMAKYDPSIWNKVLDFTGEQPFTITPVNISLRKNAGLTKKRLYREAFDSLGTVWSDEVSGKVDYGMINPTKKGEYINYYSPVRAGSDSIIAIKTSMSSTPAFVLISGGKEKTLLRPGSMYPWVLSYGGRKLVWVEERPDVRWVNRNYSVIRTFDLSSRSVNTLSRKTRFLAAAISPDGRNIAAIENTPENTNNLIILDAGSGSVLKSIPSPGNADIQRPQWSDDGASVTVIYLTDEGEGIMAWSVKENRWETMLQHGTADLQSAYLRNDSLFFVSSASGTDNIWVSFRGNTPQRLTDSRFGTKDLNVTSGELLFSDYTAEGNKISSSSIEPGLSNPSGSLSGKTFKDLIDLIEKPDISGTPVSGSYDPEPYRKWQHLLRFHSWMPFYADIDRLQADPASIRPGLTLLSQNTLSTLVSTFSYEYSADKKHIFHTGLNWYGWYPVIRAKVDYGYRPAVIGANNIMVSPGLRFSGDISLPFSFSSGYFSHYLRLTLNTEYSNNVYPTNTRGFDYGQTNFTGRIFFSNYVRSAIRDIYPRWGQTFDINRVAAPFDNDIFGSSTYVRSTFFFPGLLRDHGLRVRLEREDQDQSKFIFGNRVSFPRGFNSLLFPEGYRNIISDELNFASADYVFPVMYPDFNISSFFYLKRIRSGLFYDQSWGKGNRYYTVNEQGRLIQSAFHDYTETFRSYGIELLADFHILRIPFMISGGVQAAWKSTSQSPVINAVFNMDLYGFSIGK